MGGGPVNDRSTQAHLASRAGATPHKYNTVLYSKITRHRVPAGHPKKPDQKPWAGLCARLCHNYATIMPCPRRRGHCLLLWMVCMYVCAEHLITRAQQQRGAPAADGPQSPDKHMGRRPCQATLGHMQGRGMGLSARREVGDSPAEGEEGQGSCRSDAWTMQKHADGCGTRTQPPQCLRVAILQHCELHSLWNEDHERCCRRLAHIDTHQCRTVAARQLGRAMPRQDCRYQDRFDSG